MPQHLDAFIAELVLPFDLIQADLAAARAVRDELLQQQRQYAELQDNIALLQRVGARHAAAGACCRRRWVPPRAWGRRLFHAVLAVLRREHGGM